MGGHIGRSVSFLFLLSVNSPNLREYTRVKVDAHVVRRGLLLVNVYMVFGDTSDSVDEVICPRFFVVH